MAGLLFLLTSFQFLSYTTVLQFSVEQNSFSFSFVPFDAFHELVMFFLKDVCSIKKPEIGKQPSKQEDEQQKREE